MIKAIILEDEVPAQNLLKAFIGEHKNIEVIGVYGDGYSGCKAINELKPDLVILDIQMPKLTGIEVLELIEHKPVVIFSTAYNEYAVQAFDLNASDYLLKPFSKDRFNEAIQKAIHKISSGTPETTTEKVIEDLQEEFIQRIAVRSGSKINIINCDTIDYIESDGDYVKIHANSSRFLKEKTMKYYDKNLDNNKFIRIHRSYIANLEKIQKIEVYSKDQHIVVMENGDKIKASANGYKLLRQELDI